MENISTATLADLATELGKCDSALAIGLSRAAERKWAQYRTAINAELMARTEVSAAVASMTDAELVSELAVEVTAERMYISRSGTEREIRQAFGIFNRATGQQHKPSTKGRTGYTYPNQYAAEQAIQAMPAKYRVAYEARPLPRSRSGEGD